MSDRARSSNNAYYRIDLPDEKGAYSYSAQKLQRELNALLAGQRIQGLYVCLYGYQNSLHSKCMDVHLLSPAGGRPAAGL